MIALCSCYFLENLTSWTAFISNAVLSNLRYLFLYTILFRYANNEFIQAAGAVYMSKILLEPCTHSLKKKIAERWERYWLKRDYAQAIFTTVTFLVLLTATITNILVTYFVNDGKVYRIDEIPEEDQRALLTNM